MKFDWHHGIVTGLMVGLAVGWSEAPDRSFSTWLAVVAGAILLFQRIWYTLNKSKKDNKGSEK